MSNAEVLKFYINIFSPLVEINKNELSNSITQNDEVPEQTQLTALTPKDTTIKKVIDKPVVEEVPENDDLLIIETEEEFAENFEPTPYLDEMLTDVSRSSYIIVIAPKNEENFNADINFVWEESEQQNIHLKILNNKGKEIFTISTTKNQFHYTQNLKPGLYYWKLENEDDLLYLGKFYFQKK